MFFSDKQKYFLLHNHVLISTKVDGGQKGESEWRVAIYGLHGESLPVFMENIKKAEIRVLKLLYWIALLGKAIFT